MAGPRRFLERVYALRERVQDIPPSRELEQLQHRTIQSVVNDIDAYRFNTAVSALMIFARALADADQVPREGYTVLIQLLAPFAPYLTEEIWYSLGHSESVHRSAVPVSDAARAQQDEVTVAVQIQGKTRGTVLVPRGSNQSIVIEKIAEQARLAAMADGCSVKVYVPDKIISFV